MATVVLGIRSNKDKEKEEVFCPICKKNFTGWYCPSCGLPKIAENHPRFGFKAFEDFQLCHKCFTANPYNAKYCRRCGERIDLQAIDKDYHGWIDLGLSVLWSTDHFKCFFQWDGDVSDLDNMTITEYSDKNDACRKGSIIYHKDPATIEWGEKWRTPTKEEFEELVIKCKWEKCLHPNGEHALKATGPNGNSIFLPVTGVAGMDNDEINGRGRKFGTIIPEARYSHCFYWTSSEFDKSWGFAFSFIGYKLDFIPYDHYSLFNNCKIVKRADGLLELKRLSPYEEENEKKRSIQKDYEKRKILWLDTPVEMQMHYDTKKAAFRSVVRPQFKTYGFFIRPVADKKWQGKL